MATPKVALRSAASSSGTPLFIILDYRHNGKRIREKVTSHKGDAELIRAKVERDILLGTSQVPATKEAISLRGLVEEFLDVKKNAIQGRATTSKAWSRRTGNDAMNIMRSSGCS